VLFWAVTQRVVVIPCRCFTPPTHPTPTHRVVVDLRGVNLREFGVTRFINWDMFTICMVRNLHLRGLKRTIRARREKLLVKHMLGRKSRWGSDFIASCVSAMGTTRHTDHSHYDRYPFPRGFAVDDVPCSVNYFAPSVMWSNRSGTCWQAAVHYGGASSYRIRAIWNSPSLARFAYQCCNGNGLIFSVKICCMLSF